MGHNQYTWRWRNIISCLNEYCYRHIRARVMWHLVEVIGAAVFTKNAEKWCSKCAANTRPSLSIYWTSFVSPYILLQQWTHILFGQLQSPSGSFIPIQLISALPAPCLAQAGLECGMRFFNFSEKCLQSNIESTSHFRGNILFINAMPLISILASEFSNTMPQGCNTMLQK